MSVELEVAEALVVEPGDTLIVRMKAPITPQIANMIRERFLARVPGLAEVVVIECEGLAVYRPHIIEITPLEPK